MNSRLRRGVDIAMLVLMGAAILAVGLDVTGPTRYSVVFAAALLVPGSALAHFLHPIDMASFIGLAVVLSLAIGTVGAMILLWIGWWHPLMMGIIVATISCAALIADIRRLSRTDQGVPA